MRRFIKFYWCMCYGGKALFNVLFRSAFRASSMGKPVKFHQSQSNEMKSSKLVCVQAFSLFFCVQLSWLRFVLPTLKMQNDTMLFFSCCLIQISFLHPRIQQHRFTMKYTEIFSTSSLLVLSFFLVLVAQSFSFGMMFLWNYYLSLKRASTSETGTQKP